MVALTDHDTTGGWDDAASALPTGLSLVRGAEISCSHDGISLHLLAYLVDPADDMLSSRLAELRESRVGRAERMCRLIAVDHPGVTWDRVQELAGGVVGRPHVAQALVEQGLVETVSHAFTREWIGTGGRYWVDKLELDVVEAVGLVVGAGGVAVFAHPAAATRGRTVGDDVIADMAAAGLHGLEVDHVDHDEQGRAHLRSLASELGLLTTGSSDYHGSNKQTPIGACTTDPAQYEALLAAGSGGAVLTD